MIPVVVRTTDNMLLLVPNSLREAAAALGCPKWRMITLVCYRAAKTGIITGVLLAIARISGETAPLLFTALSNQFMSTNMNGPMANLPVVIYQYAASLQGLERPGLGRRHPDYAAGAGHQHHCPQHVPQIKIALPARMPRRT